MHAPSTACRAAGYVYHALNRAVARLPLFAKDGDFEAFERVLVEARAKHPIRLLAYCLMPPFGADAWQKRTAKKLGLEFTMRKPGRPKKPSPHDS